MSNTFGYEVSNGYIALPIVANPNTMIAQAIAAIQAELPGWVPVEGNIEMILLEQFAAMAAQAANVASSASQAIFEYYGQLIGINPLLGSPASALTTWTMTDDAGYTIPQGTVVGYQIAGNQISLFSTTQEFSTQAASPGRTIPTAQITNNSPLLLDPNESFTQADVDKSVTGTNVPADTTILSVQGYGQATMSANATGNEPSEAIVLGALAGTQVATNIPIQAQAQGTGNNGLPTGPLTLITSFSYVSSVAASTVSSGGSNVETVTSYINRLAQELQLLTPRPIIPSDFAILAQSIPGVQRATAYNNTFAGVSDVPANLVINNPIVTLAPATTIAAGSNDLTLPQLVIDCANTGDFEDAGSFVIQSSTGFSVVNYTGTTSDTFTGCTGGSGVMSTGGVISGSVFNFSAFDVGLGISGAGIPGGTTIEEYNNIVQVQMSANASSNEDLSPITIASSTNIERAVAVSCLDINGNPVSDSISSQVVTLLSSEREINFMVSYLQPSYVDLYVNYVVICDPSATPDAVASAINTAVSNFLSPASWAGGTQTPPVWDTTVEYVYYLSLASVIESVSGVQSIQVVGTTPSLGLGTGVNPAYGYHDVSLAAAIGTSLPNLIAVNGSVLVGT